MLVMNGNNNTSFIIITNIHHFCPVGYVEDFLMSINLIEVVTGARMSSQPSFKFIALEGDPGVGKSRFLRALVDVALKNSMRYDLRWITYLKTMPGHILVSRFNCHMIKSLVDWLQNVSLQ